MKILISVFLSIFSTTANVPARHVYLDDLNGDGKKELILLSNSKRIIIFELYGDRFVQAIDTVLNGAIIDFGNIYKNFGGDELVLVSNRDVEILRYTNREIRVVKRLQMQPSIIYPQHVRTIRRGKIVYKVNGEDLIAYFYPHSCVLIDTSGIVKSFHIRTYENVSTSMDKSSAVDDFEPYSIKSSYSLPLIFFANIDKTPSDEILQFYNDTLFSGNHTLLDLSFLKSEGEVQLFPPRITVKDINNDGEDDLLVYKGEVGAPFGKRSSVYLYLSKDGKFGRLPDQVIISESFSPDVILKDLNKDGKQDLVLTTSGFNLFSLIKLILTKKMDIQYSVYMFQNKTFTKTPTYSRSFSITMSSSSNLSGGIADFSSDFDGDGYTDILYFKGEKVEVYKGNGTSFEKKACCTYKIMTSSKYMITDINGNKKPDLLFWRSQHKMTKLWGLLR